MKDTGWWRPHPQPACNNNILMLSLHSRTNSHSLWFIIIQHLNFSLAKWITICFSSTPRCSTLQYFTLNHRLPSNRTTSVFVLLSSNHPPSWLIGPRRAQGPVEQLAETHLHFTSKRGCVAGSGPQRLTQCRDWSNVFAISNNLLAPWCCSATGRKNYFKLVVHCRKTQIAMLTFCVVSLLDKHDV